MSALNLQTDNSFYRFEGPDLQSFEPRLFDAAWLRDNHLLTREIAQGRGTTFCLCVDQQSLVLRHYRRGGAIRRLSQNRFVWTGLERTRPFTEFELLRQMTCLGLPCPEPYACQVVRFGSFYTGALIMHEIPRAATLAEILCKREVINEEWTALGLCLRRFHDASVFHSDLNANNILLNDVGDVYLIDFDKSRIRPGHGNSWKSATLKRLQRSIMKCRANTDTFYFSPANWDVLRDGYLSAKSDQRSSRSA